MGATGGWHQAAESGKRAAGVSGDGPGPDQNIGRQSAGRGAGGSAWARAHSECGPGQRATDLENSGVNGAGCSGRPSFKLDAARILAASQLELAELGSRSRADGSGPRTVRRAGLAAATIIPGEQPRHPAATIARTRGPAGLGWQESVGQPPSQPESESAEARSVVVGVTRKFVTPESEASESSGLANLFGFVLLHELWFPRFIVAARFKVFPAHPPQNLEFTCMLTASQDYNNVYRRNTMMLSQTILQRYIGSIRFKERVIEGSVSNIDRKITSGPATARRRQVALPTRWDACSSGATRREPLRPGGGTRSRVRPDPGRAYAPSLRVVEIPLPQIHGSGMPPNVGARKHTGHAYYLAHPQSLTRRARNVAMPWPPSFRTGTRSSASR